MPRIEGPLKNVMCRIMDNLRKPEENALFTKYFIYIAADIWTFLQTCCIINARNIKGVPNHGK